MNKAEDIKRDRWQRPLLPHPDTGIVEPYTRASTLSSAIDNKYDLEKWKQRQVLIGLSQRPDLVAQVQGNPGDKKALNEIAETCMEVAGSSAGANLGTAIHNFCEMVDKGNFLPTVELRIRASIDAYQARTENFKMVAIEEFVAVRTVMAAGSFDRIIETKSGRRYIADIKTGLNAPDFAHSTAVQMAVYSRGWRYSTKDGWGDWLPDLGVNQEVGILIHLPASGEPVCNLYFVDLKAGWEMAEIAYRVRQWWKEKPASLVAGSTKTGSTS